MALVLAAAAYPMHVGRPQGLAMRMNDQTVDQPAALYWSLTKPACS